jgi:hypothetical protein
MSLAKQGTTQYKLLEAITTAPPAVVAQPRVAAYTGAVANNRVQALNRVNNAITIVTDGTFTAVLNGVNDPKTAVTVAIEAIRDADIGGGPHAGATTADVQDLLTRVRVLVNGLPVGSNQADILGVGIADEAERAVRDALTAGTAANNHEEALNKLDNALAATRVAAGYGPAAATNEAEAVALVTAAGIVPTEGSVKGLLYRVRDFINPGDPNSDRAAIGMDPNDNTINLAVDALFNNAGGAGVIATNRGNAIHRINNAIRQVPTTGFAQPTNIENAIMAIEQVDINDGGAAGGGNQYVYGKQKAYPKNVTFSKKTTNKQKHHKTVRRLQNIINNAL